MNTELITRLIGLIEKTGDKVVLADPLTGKAVVVMDLDAYERLNTVGSAVSAPAKPAPVRMPPEAIYKEESGWNDDPGAEPVSFEEKPAPVRVPAARHGRLKAVDEPHSGRQFKAIQAEKAAPAPVMQADLTQDELLDKINREIGAWKNAQEKKRTVELQSAAQTISRFETVKAFEEEERFYLEPIE